MITIEIDDKKIHELLSKLVEKTKKLRPVMNDIGAIIHESIMQNFESQGRPKWQDLSPTTKALRAIEGKWPGQILNRHSTSGLLGSVNYRTTDDSVSVGTNKVYAPLMQFGARKGKFGKKNFTQQVREHIRKGSQVKAHTRKRKKKIPIPWGNIPARPFIMVQNADIDDVTNMLERYIREGF